MFGLKAGVVVGALLMAAPAYLVGHWRGSADGGELATLRAELEAATAQNQAAQIDLATARAAAERSEAAAAREKQLAEAQTLELAEYEAELARRPAADSCRLTDDDVRRMRQPHDSTTVGRPGTAGRQPDLR